MRRVSNFSIFQVYWLHVIFIYLKNIHSLQIVCVTSKILFELSTKNRKHKKNTQADSIDRWGIPENVSMGDQAPPLISPKVAWAREKCPPHPLHLQPVAGGIAGHENLWAGVGKGEMPPLPLTSCFRQESGSLSHESGWAGLLRPPLTSKNDATPRNLLHTV